MAWSEITAEFSSFAGAHAGTNTASKAFPCSRFRLAVAAATVGVRHWWLRSPSVVTSFFDALARFSAVLSVVSDTNVGLCLSPHFAGLDATEKGCHSYVLGMACTSVLYELHLSVPWLQHLDPLIKSGVATLAGGKDRPDLVGLDTAANWHAVEAKGRSSGSVAQALLDAKTQAVNLTQVNGVALATTAALAARLNREPFHCQCEDPQPSANPSKVEFSDESFLRAFYGRWMLAVSKGRGRRRVDGLDFKTSEVPMPAGAARSLEIGVERSIVSAWDEGVALVATATRAARALRRTILGEAVQDYTETSPQRVVTSAGLYFRLS
jgi:hypothetical protein